MSPGEDEVWHVVAMAGRGRAAAPEVSLRRGEPPLPTFTFYLHYPTLVKIDRGDISASTAMVRGLASDPGLMSPSSSPGLEITPEAVATLEEDTFHFWTRGVPEVVPFGDEHARTVHGADVVVLHYARGLRSGWFSLKEGQHANADPRLQVNPFPTLLVVTSGTGRGRIGGEELELGAGRAVLVPAGVGHEFRNSHDEPVEGFILMFGEGA